jgi:tocopherol cyclase
LFDFPRTTMHPEGYHGHGKRPPFFEGWYYKLIDPTEQHRYAIIPGIYLAPDAGKTHAFVQILNGRTGQVVYHSYPAAEFVCPPAQLDIRLGPNRFTAQSLVLDVAEPGFQMSSELRFPEIHPWPVTVASPGIMGWYAWAPFMECYHGVVSLDHAIQGSLVINGQSVDFTGGRGYTEKDWGRSFPSAWVWMQTNHFPEPGVSLSASVAIIPWIGRSFPGFIVGLWLHGRLFRLATYTGAHLEELTLTDQNVQWAVRDGHHRLEMTAARTTGGLLKAPSTLEMDRRVVESLQAAVTVRLTEWPGGGLVFEGTGRHAGLEVGGDMARLLAMAQALR